MEPNAVRKAGEALDEREWELSDEELDQAVGPRASATCHPCVFACSYGRGASRPGTA